MKVLASAVLICVFVAGCATPPGNPVGAKAKGGQLESYRGGKAFVSSPQPGSFVTVSLLRDKMADDGQLPPIMVTVGNTGTAPLDVKLADFELRIGQQVVRLRPKSEILQAQARDQRIRMVLLAAGGALEGAAAGARSRSSVSGSATTEYRASDGRYLGTGQTQFQGSIKDPQASRAAADAAADRTGEQIARVQAGGARDRADADRLLLDRETVFPGQSMTFALVPEKPATPVSGAGATFVLRAHIGADGHVFNFVRP